MARRQEKWKSQRKLSGDGNTESASGNFVSPLANKATVQSPSDQTLLLHSHFESAAASCSFSSSSFSSGAPFYEKQNKSSFQIGKLPKAKGCKFRSCCESFYPLMGSRPGVTAITSVLLSRPGISSSSSSESGPSCSKDLHHRGTLDESGRQFSIIHIQTQQQLKARHTNAQRIRDLTKPPPPKPPSKSPYPLISKSS